jgi:hypothetical protein
MTLTITSSVSARAAFSISNGRSTGQARIAARAESAMIGT